MIINGDTITFEHLLLTATPYEMHLGHRLIISWFDGEPNLWLTRICNPNDEELTQVVDELREYYRRDWEGTNQQIHIAVFPHAEHSSLNFDLDFNRYAPRTG